MYPDISSLRTAEITRGWLLQALLSQVTHAHLAAMDTVDPGRDLQRSVLPLALAIEQHYTQAEGWHFPLPLPAFTNFLNDLHQRLGGTFRVEAASPDGLQLCTEHCLWQGSASHQPQLCGLMVMLYTALAAHNFGYACTTMTPAAVAGRGPCRLHIALSPGLAAAHGTVVTRQEVDDALTPSHDACTAGVDGDMAQDAAQTEFALTQRLSHALQIARQATQEREQLSSMKEQFLANVTHELRTPLTSIEGYLSLLEDGTLGVLQPEQMAALTVVLRNVDRFKQMVEELLDFSTLVRGQYLLEGRVLDLAGILRDALQHMRSEADAHGITLVADIPDTLGPVLGNGEKLLQVVEHLLGNAVKFSEPGTHVRLTGFRHEHYCYIEVSDHGIGMTPEQLSRAFMPFVQGEMTLVRRHEGLGMGLSLVHNLIALHEGDIGITSTPGEGTNVLVRLPLHEERARLYPATNAEVMSVPQGG